MIWLAFAGLAILALLPAAIAVMRRPSAMPDAAALDIALGQRQLAEIEVERTRGLIADADADAARTEIARRLLRVSQESSGGRPLQASTGIIRLGAIGLLLILGSVFLYRETGRPDAVTAFQLPLAQSIEAIKPPASDAEAPSVGPDGAPLLPVPVLLDRLEARLNEMPERLDVWVLLGRTALNAGDARRAARAFAEARRLDPDNAELHAREGEALVTLAEGRVTPAADLAFANALARDAGQPIALWFVGLGLLQNQRAEDAAARWRELLAVSPEDAPWRETVSASLAMLERQLAAEQNTIADPTAILELDPEERGVMIAGMVERLAARLAGQPDDIDGWIRLARSYRVLGNVAAAEAALRSARERAPADRLEEIDRLIAEYAP